MTAGETRTTKVSHISLNGSGILEVKILPGVRQSMQAARENVAACLESSGTRARPLLLDLRDAEPLDPEVRRYYASQEVSTKFRAIALLVSASPFGLALGNFYISVARGMAKQRLFHDRNQAMAWLEEQK